MSFRAFFLILLSSLFFVACGAQPSQPLTVAPTPVNTQTVSAASGSPRYVSFPTLLPATPTSVPAPKADYSTKLANATGDYFAGAGNCNVCHTNLKDAAGNDISFDTLWRSTSMASAAIDPYFLATVRAEVADFPNLRPTIETTCATCHMPMARFTTVQQGGAPKMFDADGYNNPSHPLNTLALDGVSCTVCHQIQAGNLGQPASFSGGMQFDFTKNFGNREIYGSFPPDPLGSVMGASSGFMVVQGQHLTGAELCATCHTLYTPHLTAAGEVSDQLFPEQTPYLEWKNSAYANDTTCQACHMPAAQGEAAVSNMGSAKRSPVGQHTFVGGNTLLLEMLKLNPNETRPSADAAHFDATIQRTNALLTTQTASVAIDNVAIQDGQLSFNVNVTNQVGHKFPTAYPSRRAWLHVTVTDAGGQVIFESGKLDGGKIAGNENDASASAFEPHYDLISSPDQVQIYESIMGTETGEVTTSLLRAAQYLKDNRLLPRGFDKAAVPADTAVYGGALQDANFDGGSDRVTYQLAITGDGAGLKISVELLYSPIGYRWAQNISSGTSAEAQKFQQYLNGVPYSALLVSQQAAEVQK